jgi:uric acid transporter
VIAAGIFAIVAAPFMGRLLPLFPPVVAGTIILVIGISLMRVGINWAGGGLPTLTKVVDGVPGTFPNPGYGQLEGLGIALFVLLVILGLLRWFTGFVANVAVLLGIIAGAVLASLLGVMHFERVLSAAWGRRRDPVPVRPTVIPAGADRHHVHRHGGGDDRVHRNVSRARRNDRAEDRSGGDCPRTARGRVGTLLGGIFNTFPYTSFSQNVGLVGVTGIRSRWVTATGGLIMLALRLLPKMSALVEAVPVVVLGGAGVVMFGMVAATGARILTNVDFKTNRYNLFIVAISVGFGMIPLVAPNFFRYTPDVLHPLLESGILLAAIVSVLLNVFFNGLGSVEAAQHEASMVAATSEHAGV